ncbi:MAG: hypothetical protein NXI24_24550 [bacterium]|nr:hypothetical protein [bacterium]
MGKIEECLLIELDQKKRWRTSTGVSFHPGEAVEYLAGDRWIPARLLRCLDFMQLQVAGHDRALDMKPGMRLRYWLTPSSSDSQIPRSGSSGSRPEFPSHMHWSEVRHSIVAGEAILPMNVNYWDAYYFFEGKRRDFIRNEIVSERLMLYGGRRSVSGRRGAKLVDTITWTALPTKTAVDWYQKSLGRFYDIVWEASEDGSQYGFEDIVFGLEQQCPFSLSNLYGAPVSSSYDFSMWVDAYCQPNEVKVAQTCSG